MLLAAVLAVSTCRTAAINASLIAHYSFDDGTASEASDASLDGTIEGATATVGWDGLGALAFDGDDSVVFPGAATAAISGGSPRTVCLWARLDAFDHGALFAWGSYVEYGEFGLLTYDDVAHVRVQFYGDSSLATYVPLEGFAVGAWHHYCVAFDGATWSLYFDGGLAKSGAAALHTGTDQPLRLGERARDGFELVGALDDLRLYAGALAAEGACSLANATACGDEADDDVLLGATKKATGGDRRPILVSLFALGLGVAVFGAAACAYRGAPARRAGGPPVVAAAAARPYPPAACVAAVEPDVPIATAYAVDDAGGDHYELPALAVLRGK